MVAGCCIPGCTTVPASRCASIYKVPSGKRVRGCFTAQWRKDFINILYKIRVADKGFKRQIENQTARICYRHFKEDCIIKNVGRSWLKHGALPTENLPQKSHTKVIKERKPPKQRTFVPPVPPPPLKKTVEIVEQFKKLKTNWKMTQISSNDIRFQLFDRTFLTAIREIHTDNNLNIKILVHGLPIKNVPSVSFVFLEDVMTYAANVSLCPGVPHHSDLYKMDDWSQICIYSHNGSVHSRRYLHARCRVAVDNSTKMCDGCKFYYFNSEHCKSRVKEYQELNGAIPLPDSCKRLNMVSNGRLIATIKSLRSRLQKKEKEIKEANESKIANKADRGTMQECRVDETSSLVSKYPPPVIKFCENLYMKNPDVYMQLVVNEVLALPTKEELRQNSVEQQAIK